MVDYRLYGGSDGAVDYKSVWHCMEYPKVTDFIHATAGYWIKVIK